MPTPVPEDRLVVAPLSELDLKEADSGVKARWLTLGLIVGIAPSLFKVSIPAALYGIGLELILE